MLKLPAEFEVCRHVEDYTMLIPVGEECDDMIPAEDVEEAIESGVLNEDVRDQGPVCEVDDKPCNRAKVRIDWVDEPLPEFV